MPDYITAAIAWTLENPWVFPAAWAAIEIVYRGRDLAAVYQAAKLILAKLAASTDLPRERHKIIAKVESEVAELTSLTRDQVHDILEIQPDWNDPRKTKVKVNAGAALKAVASSGDVKKALGKLGKFLKKI